jgi:hypothetical protein
VSTIGFIADNVKRGLLHNYEWLENLLNLDMRNTDRILPEQKEKSYYVSIYRLIKPERSSSVIVT